MRVELSLLILSKELIFRVRSKMTKAKSLLSLFSQEKDFVCFYLYFLYRDNPFEGLVFVKGSQFQISTLHRPENMSPVSI